ncbi:DUF6406 domain-containing protein [Thermomonospora amylolytica]|uniref:DUF6406 domain-containing protein n=1 Tax=Thermomonospora amylolytica TaxID=1411117 RepID=UPI001F38C997|nr:DUF6406 domain-containing protein [Thermomonospora amylolytica]
MEVREIVLQRTRQRRTGIGRFAVFHVCNPPDGTGPRVRLMVVTDEARFYDLRLGETFPVGTRTWRLDRVENATGPDWAVILVRAGD